MSVGVALDEEYPRETPKRESIVPERLRDVIIEEIVRLIDESKEDKRIRAEKERIRAATQRERERAGLPEQATVSTTKLRADWALNRR